MPEGPLEEGSSGTDDMAPRDPGFEPQPIDVELARQASYHAGAPQLPLQGNQLAHPVSQATAPAPTTANNGGWDGIDRRKADKGPPPGTTERRRPYRVFGQRDLA